MPCYSITPGRDIELFSCNFFISLPQDRNLLSQDTKSLAQISKSLPQDRKSIPQVRKSFPQVRKSFPQDSNFWENHALIYLGYIQNCYTVEHNKSTP